MIKAKGAKSSFLYLLLFSVLFFCSCSSGTERRHISDYKPPAAVSMDDDAADKPIEIEPLPAKEEKHVNDESESKSANNPELRNTLEQMIERAGEGGKISVFESGSLHLTVIPGYLKETTSCRDIVVIIRTGNGKSARIKREYCKKNVH